MAVTVIIDNHTIDQRIVMMISQDDILATETVWETVSPIVKALIDVNLSDRMIPWGKVNLKQYQFLIKKQLEKYVDLDLEDQYNLQHETVNTLRFLFCAYIRKITELTGSDVDVIKIQKIGPTDYSVNIALNIVLATAAKQPSLAKPDFKIIIDNTKEDE